MRKREQQKREEKTFYPLEQYPMVTDFFRTYLLPRRQTMPRFTLSAWLNNAQLAIGWTIILLMLSIAGGTYLIQISQTAMINRNTQTIVSETLAVHQVNNKLMEEIAMARSLDQLQSRIKSLGNTYVDPNTSQTEYLPVVVPVVAAPIPPAETPQNNHPQTFGEALWLFIRESVSILARGVAKDGNK